MSTNVKIYVNCDTQDLPVGTTGVDWVEVNKSTDSFIFSNGSDVVKEVLSHISNTGSEAVAPSKEKQKTYLLF